MFLCTIIDASPDTFETPQPNKGPSSSIDINPNDVDDEKHDDLKPKNTG